MPTFSIPSKAPPRERPARTNVDGDSLFLGMDMKTPRQNLQPGYYALAINKRTENGVPDTRNGTVAPAFANAMPFTGGIVGSGVYSNPNGVISLVVGLPKSVLLLSDGLFPITVPIPSSVTLVAPISFDQNFNVLFLNSPTVTLSWDGVNPAGFVINTRQNPGDPTLTITPNVVWSQNVNTRRMFPLTSDSVGVTPIADYTEFNAGLGPASGVFRVNTGTSDAIIGAAQYSQNNVIIFKRTSVDIMANFIGDLSSLQMQPLSSTIGCVSRKAIQMVGADIIFPFDTGIFRIQQVIQDRLMASALPVSAYVDPEGNIVDPIEPLLRRINWNFAGNMVAQLLSPYYYLAVPLDGSTVNNAILVYNTIKDKWEGYDTFAGPMVIDDLWMCLFQGKMRLFAVDNHNNSVYVLYEGKSDILLGTEYQIQDTFETRGYTAPAAKSMFKKAIFGINTWKPSITVNELTDGAFDTRLLTPNPVTKDPTKYNVFGKAPYVTSNINNDFNTPGRQDYSVPDGFFTFAGINVDQRQQSTLKFAMITRARWISYRIQNNQGQCEINGILVESQIFERETLRAA